MLISKTFDASVICPAEQTCVIDDGIWDETVAELERMGARLLEDEVERLAQLAFAPDGSVEMRALGQSCVNLASMAGFETASEPRSCWPRSPPTPRNSRAIRSCARS